MGFATGFDCSFGNERFATNKNYRDSKENTSRKHECLESQENQGQSSGAKLDDDVLKDFMQI